MALVVAGSYERFVFGYRVDGLPSSSSSSSSARESGAAAAAVNHAFTLDAHLTQCKSVAARCGFIASGGADDLVRVYHHNPDGALADLGTLAGHEGTVQCMELHGPSSSTEPTRLVTGGQDGTIIVWSVNAWDALKTLKAHRGGVQNVSVHKSGAVALSSGADGCVAMWDMKRGRVAHKTKLKVKPELLSFTPSGTKYYACAQSRTTITSAETGAVCGVFDAPSRVMCATMAGSDALAVLGLEGGDVVGYDTRAPPTKHALRITKAHPTRVKGVVVPYDDHDAGVAMGGPAWGATSLVTASSEGVVRLWDLRVAGKGGGAASARDIDEPVAEAEGGGRFTCLAVMPCALPRAVADVLSAERDARASDPAERAARRGEEKQRKLEKARAKAAMRPARPPPVKAKRPSAAGETADGGDNDEREGFEVVPEGGGGGGDGGGAPRVEPRREPKKPKKRERAEGERFGGDELLVTRKPSHKVKKSGGGDGKSYEETATAARRKGSGVKKKEASRGFGKPSSARR